MLSKRSQRSRSRPTTPQSPPKQNASHVSPLSQRRSTRSRSLDKSPPPPRKQARKNLPPVDEEVDDDDDIEILQPKPASEYASIDDEGLERQFSDDVDDASSNGDTQLESLDTDLIVDNLPTLYQIADRIVSLFSSEKPLDILKEINVPLSRTTKRLVNFTAQLHSARQAYGNGSYISVPLVVHKLSGDVDVADGPWRPDAILQLANLSLLITNLAHNDDTGIHDTLDRMYNTYPEPFGDLHMTVDTTTYSTQLVYETISFGIDLRTQFFLKCVEKYKGEPRFDPDGILHQVFFDEHNNLRGFQIDGDEVFPEAEDAILERLEEIQKFFRKSSKSPIDLPRLKQKYPWLEFMTNAFRWISLRGQELKDQIVAQGGVAAIQDRLASGDLAPYHTNTSPNASAVSQNVRESQELAIPERLLQRPSAPSPSAMTIARRVKRFQKIKAQHESPSDDDSGDEEDEEDREVQPREGSVQETPIKLQPAARETQPSPIVIDTDNGSTPRPDEDSHGNPDAPDEPEATPRNNHANVSDKVLVEPEVSIPVDHEDGIFIDGDNDVDRSEISIEHKEHASPPIPTQSSIIPTQQTLAVLAVANEQAALSSKENIAVPRQRYADRQPNATRISWDETQTGAKRSRYDAGEDDIDDDEGEEYETDTRPSKRPRDNKSGDDGEEDGELPVGDDDEVASPQEEDEEEELEVAEASAQVGNNMNTAPAPSSQVPPSAQIPSHRSPLRDVTTTHEDSPPPRPTQVHRKIAVARSPSPFDIPSSTAEHHRGVNERAKATVRLRTVTRPDSRRDGQHAARKPWSFNETERLFEMIALHGCQWAHILQEDASHEDGPELKDRTQVQLKDKARNLKMDYLKAGEELPIGFAAVTIKATDKALLRKLGMPYE